MHGGGLDGFDIFIGVVAIVAPGLLAGILVSLVRRRGGLATIAIAAFLSAIGLFLFFATISASATEQNVYPFLAFVSFVPSLLGAIIGTSFGAVLADRLTGSPRE